MAKKRPHVGRPSILETHDLEKWELEELYEELGSYRAVAAHLKCTERTIINHLSKHGKRRQGRPKGSYRSKVHSILAEAPQLLLMPSEEFARSIRDHGGSASYAKKVYIELKRKVEKHIIAKLRKLLRQSSAIRDVKGRLIPTEAIRFVWIPRIEWNKAIYARAILKDRTHVKIMTSIVARPEDIISRSVSSDQSPGTSSSS